MLATGLIAQVLGTVAGEPEVRTWTVDGAVREALVCVPASAHATPTPVVFVFHGYGGSMRHMSETFPVHTLWPESLVVYMQGLPLSLRLKGLEVPKPGWQNVSGTLGDRDLKFFDAVMDALRTDYRVDERRVYATGHSNGGGFVYLLWAARPYAFSAFAPCAAFSLRPERLRPKPVLHVAGVRDAVVKFAWQRRTLDAVRRVNRCLETGRPWGTNAVFYASAAGAPLVELIHPGGHELPPEALPSVVRFFKERSASVSPGT